MIRFRKALLSTRSADAPQPEIMKSEGHADWVLNRSCPKQTVPYCSAAVPERYRGHTGRVFAAPRVELQLGLSYRVIQVRHGAYQQ